MRRLAPALVTLALLAGCGDDEPADPGTTVPGGKGSSLELTLDADGPGSEDARSATVDCPDPPGPGPDEPCGVVLLKSPEDLDPVPAEVPCTEIYGGPDTLRVTGMLEGEPVEATLTRENGCEIERYDTWLDLLHRLFPDYEPGEALAP
ncbi:MAG: hypothetical protein ABI726_02010 [bacterium]